MKPIGRAVFILFPCMLPLFLAFSADRVQSEKTVDHSLYAELLRKHVKGFFLRYAEGDLKTRLAQGREEIGVRYLDYDWSLNGE